MVSHLVTCKRDQEKLKAPFVPVSRPPPRGSNCPHAYFGWITSSYQGAASDQLWYPSTSRCPLSVNGEHTACRWILKGTQAVTMISRTGPGTLQVQHYQCTEPSHRKPDGNISNKVPAWHPCLREEALADPRVRPSMCVYHSQWTTMSCDLISYLWAQIAWTSSWTWDIRRNIYFCWHSQLESEMVHCDTPEAIPHLVTRAEKAQQALPDAQTPRCVAYALWAMRYKMEPPVPAFVIEDETRYLHFDFTYLVVLRIFVKHNNKRLQLSYTLGPVQGSFGLVLATRILPMAIWNYMRLLFDDTSKQCTQPPVMIWIDDWGKWHRLLLGLCAAVFGAGHGTRNGQDWRHYKKILLAHID